MSGVEKDLCVYVCVCVGMCVSASRYKAVPKRHVWLLATARLLKAWAAAVGDKPTSVLQQVGGICLEVWHEGQSKYRIVARECVRWETGNLRFLTLPPDKHLQVCKRLLPWLAWEVTRAVVLRGPGC